jgi:hypothetical protein
MNEVFEDNLVSDPVFKLRKSPNRWSCLAAAFATVLDIEIEDVIREVGHDGSEEVCASDPEPYNRRGFSIQEMIDLCLIRGVCVTHIERDPIWVNRYGNVHHIWTSGDERFAKHLEGRVGVLTGVMHEGDHAVAWDGHQIYCPKGIHLPDC